MEITQLMKSNRLPRKEKGQRFETDRAFFLRYYHTTEDGERKQKAILVAYKSDLYRSWADVEPLIEAELSRVNAEAEGTIPTGRVALSEFVEKEFALVRGKQIRAHCERLQARLGSLPETSPRPGWAHSRAFSVAES
jgi:hypothetical protein